MRVVDFMTEHPVTVEPQAPLSKAMQLLSELDIRHLPVVEGDALVGMISDRDLRLLSEGDGIQPEVSELQSRYAQAVSNVMHSDVLTVKRHDNIKHAASLLIEHKVGALPVVEDDGQTLVGILSYVDVLKALEELLDD